MQKNMLIIAILLIGLGGLFAVKFNPPQAYRT